MFTEITGPPGAGKSVFCKNARRKGVLNLPAPLEANTWFVAVESLFLALFLLFIPLGRILYIARYSSRSDRRWRFKVNVFRNVVKKIMRFEVLRGIGRNKAVIDEGISHIPFLFGLENDYDYELFFEQFESYLEVVDIVIILGSQSELERRLRKRGHKRLSGRNAPSVSDFVANNILVQAAMVVHYSTRLSNVSVRKAPALIDSESKHGAEIG